MAGLQPYWEQTRFTSMLPSISSGIKNSDGQILTGKGLLTGCMVFTDGNNDATVVLYDNTSAAGKVITKFVVAAAENFGGVVFGAVSVVVETGIYLDISGTGATCIIYYYSPKYVSDDLLVGS